MAANDSTFQVPIKWKLLSTVSSNGATTSVYESLQDLHNRKIHLTLTQSPRGESGRYSAI